MFFRLFPSGGKINPSRSGGPGNPEAPPVCMSDRGDASRENASDIMRQKMGLCYFVSDMHGDAHRFRKLFQAIARERPKAVFVGGDIFLGSPAVTRRTRPAARALTLPDVTERLEKLRRVLGHAYPRIFVILGNDDPRIMERPVEEAERRGYWTYVHFRTVSFEDATVYGYACVPPTPFLLKDWERYDISRYVDPDSVSPEEGRRTVAVSEQESKYATIKDDLERLAGRADLAKAVFLFHSPPYQSLLDRGEEGRMIDYVPLDRHLGSIAIRRFIQDRQPRLTLHGHIHESAGITKSWRDRIGRTHCFSAAHDGPELALIRFDLDDLDAAARELL